MQSAALMLIGRKPGVFFGATEQFENEIADLVNEVAEDVARYQDWEALQSIATITGDGSTLSFPLPADYSRMLTDGEVQSASYRLWGYFRYNDLSEFMRDKAAGFRASPGGWIISGGKLQFNPAPSGASSYPYISTNWAKDSMGVRKSRFTADDDAFLLPERLLKLGLVWRWRENKKLDASGDQEAFIKALDEYAAKDGGTRVYRYGGHRSFPNTRLAWPWPLG